MTANSNEEVVVKCETLKQEPAVSAGVTKNSLTHELHNVLCPIILLCDKVTNYIELNGDPADPGRAEALDEMRTIKESATEAACVLRKFAASSNRSQIQKSLPTEACGITQPLK